MNSILTIVRQIAEFSAAWRDSWLGLFNNQSRLVKEFERVYAPLDSATQNGALTFETALTRTHKLGEGFEDLQRDLLQEIDAIDQLVITPASRAKEDLNPMRKTIKKRAERKVDKQSRKKKKIK